MSNRISEVRDEIARLFPHNRAPIPIALSWELDPQALWHAYVHIVQRPYDIDTEGTSADPDTALASAWKQAKIEAKIVGPHD